MRWYLACLGLTPIAVFPLVVLFVPFVPFVTFVPVFVVLAVLCTALFGEVSHFVSPLALYMYVFPVFGSVADCQFCSVLGATAAATEGVCGGAAVVGVAAGERVVLVGVDVRVGVRVGVGVGVRVGVVVGVVVGVAVSEAGGMVQDVRFLPRL